VIEVIPSHAASVEEEVGDESAAKENRTMLT